jgi:hypothetical protein
MLKNISTVQTLDVFGFRLVNKKEIYMFDILCPLKSNHNGLCAYKTNEPEVESRFGSM